MIFYFHVRSRAWKPIFKTTRLKLRWMPIKSTGTVPAGNQIPFRFATEIMREREKHRSNFQKRLKPTSGFADADARVVNPTVTDRISRGDELRIIDFFEML